MALTYRSGLAAVGSASGNITLAEPAGTAVGDLLVAIIAYRSNAPFTVPAGWTKAEEQNFGDIQTVAAGISSICVAYIIRGASAPSFLFTRTGGDIARATVNAYQPTTGGVPTLDSSNSFTNASALGTLTLSSLTTTHAGCVVIAGLSGVRGNASPNWSAYANATDPTTHTERNDSSTTTGADLSLASSDGQQSAMGATGAFTATCVFTGRHCGALLAFYESAPTITGTVDQTTTIAAQAASGIHSLAGFPTVTNTQTSTATGFTHSVTLPSGLVSGDVCVIVMGAGGTSSNLTWPSGWTKIAEDPNSAIISIAYRVCDGSEGASITVSTVQSIATEFIAHRITGAHQTTPPEAGVTAAQVGTTSANPAALTPSWGAENTLWIAAASGAQTALPSYPTSYDHSQNAVANNGHIATASRQVNTATEDPGSFIYGASLTRRAATIAVRVYAAAPAVTGTIAQTTTIVAQAASGTVTAAPAVTGTIAQTITKAAQAASGTAQDNITGTVAQTITRAAQTATGSVAVAGAIVGQIDQTTARTIQAAAGIVTAPTAVGRSFGVIIG